MPLQRVVSRKRRATTANNRLAIMPGGRLQVSHGVTFPVKRLVTPPDPTFPQLHVNLLDSLCLTAFFSFVHRSRIRETSHLRYASRWAGGSDVSSPRAALPFRVGFVLALDYRLGVPGSSSSASSDLRHLLGQPSLH